VSAFEAIQNLRPHLLRDGITARAVDGERITMAVVDLDPDAHLPEHHHENEQLGSSSRERSTSASAPTGACSRWEIHT
jgi:hypothetical protein